MIVVRNDVPPSHPASGFSYQTKWRRFVDRYIWSPFVLCLAIVVIVTVIAAILISSFSYNISASFIFNAPQTALFAPPSALSSVTISAPTSRGLSSAVDVFFTPSEPVVSGSFWRLVDSNVALQYNQIYPKAFYWTLAKTSTVRVNVQFTGSSGSMSICLMNTVQYLQYSSSPNSGLGNQNCLSGTVLNLVTSLPQSLSYTTTISDTYYLVTYLSNLQIAQPAAMFNFDISSAIYVIPSAGTQYRNITLTSNSVKGPAGHYILLQSAASPSNNYSSMTSMLNSEVFRVTINNDDYWWIAVAVLVAIFVVCVAAIIAAGFVATLIANYIRKTQGGLTDRTAAQIAAQIVEQPVIDPYPTTNSSSSPTMVDLPENNSNNNFIPQQNYSNSSPYSYNNYNYTPAQNDFSVAPLPQYSNQNNSNNSGIITDPFDIQPQFKNEPRNLYPDINSLASNSQKNNNNSASYDYIPTFGKNDTDWT